MEAQKPAEGILTSGEYGDAKFYHIQCDCGGDECSHDVQVEVDDFGVQVHIYVKVHTKWWKNARWKQIWEIFTKGYAETQTTIVLNEQTALNYAETLRNAMNDVKEFKNARTAKSSS